MKVKYSFSIVLTAISLAGMLLGTVMVSIIFIIRMWSLTTNQVETYIKDQTENIRHHLILTFANHEQALYQTSAGIATLYEKSGEQNLDADAIPTEEMRAFLSRNRNTMKNVTQVFMANNIPTFEEGGYAVFSPRWDFPDNYDQRTRPWYRDAKAKAGAVSYTDPYMAMATGIFSTSLSTIIFDNNRNDIGVLVLDIAVSSLTDITNAQQSINGLESWLLNKDGIFISNKDAEKVMKVNFFEDRGLEQYRQSVLNSETFFSMGKEYIICSSLIPGADWIVVSTIPTHEIFAELNDAIFSAVILGTGLILALLAILIFVIYRFSKPITTITSVLKDISEGEGDLTRQITVKANNEIGALAHYFNLTLEKIKNLVMIIKKEASDLHELGDNLASHMVKTASSINQITNNIQSIKGRALNQSASVTETNATMEQVTQNITKLNELVERQSVNVSQTSSAIDQMVANINSVTQTLIKNANNVQALQKASETGRSGLQEVVTDIQEIARESEGLLEINSVMENIASQTNLLSMNAAIEAAHAGEAGKGFAVVADEIRKLAESSSEQSKTIGTVLKKITDSIGKITHSTENVLHEFGSIDSSVKTVVEQEDNIRNAMEKQGAGSKQILDDIEEVTEITRLVKNGSVEMLDGSKEVIQESRNLAKATKEITSGMNEMASGAEQINTAVYLVSDLSDKNRESINQLLKEVSRFKVE